MSKVRLTGSNSGYVEIAAVADAGNLTFTMPTSGTALLGNNNNVFSGITTTGQLDINGSIDVSSTSVFNDDVTLTGGSYNVVWDKSDNQLEFADNAKLSFGASSDMQLYHDGNHSYIDDAGTGNLRFRSGTLEIQNLAGNKTSAIFSSGGGQTLNFNNSTKFVTTNTGVNITGICTATSFSGSGASLTNLPAANLTGTLPAISGANLTNLNASNIASGTVPTARLGSGTASSSTFLAGDSTFKTITGTTINNNADNRVITGSGSANTLNGEANLTFNSSLVVTDGNGTVTTGGNYINLKRTSGNTNYINAPQSNAELVISADENIQFKTVHTGDFNSTERLRIHANGRIEPKYSSSAGATGGIIMVGGFQARPSAHHAEGVVQAKTNTNAHCFDAAGWYDNTNYRYVPQVKGHYIFYLTGMMYTGMNGNSVEQSLHVRLNGSGLHTYATGYNSNFGNYDLNTVTVVIYCNGTTDYVDWTLSSNRSPQIHSASVWSGFLLYPAA